MIDSCKTLSIDVWSDFACPWCWIAKRRFETALEQFEHKDQIRINFKSYRLARGLAPTPIKQVLVQKFGGEQAANGFIASIQAHAQDAGLTYNFDTLLFGDTTAVNAVVKAAEEIGLGKALSERLYEASITRGVSLYDLEAVTAEAAALDIPPALVAQAWTDDHWARMVTNDESAAKTVGNGVPLFLFDNSFVLSGAQTVEVFKQALEKMHSAANDALMFQGQVCGLDGCDQ